MYSSKLFAQVVEYQKTLFDNSFAMLAALQDQGHQMMSRAFEKTPLVTDDSKTMCSGWVDFVKQNRNNCKGFVDNGFDRIKEFFAASKPISPVENPVEKPSVKN